MSKINADLDKRLKETEACYNFEKLNYESGLLDTNVDVTYIIHLENSGRYDNIIKQLEKNKPTKTVYILHNKGFGKCNKMGIKTSYADLTDCYLQIFKHAQQQNYGNILILEDDFVFSEKIKEKEHITNINNFLEKKSADNFIYFLGAIPWFLIPYDSYNYRCICSSGTHSVIYSKSHRDDFLENFNRKMLVTDWDINYNINFTSRFIYYTPLCYQICSNTDNSKNPKFQNKYLSFASDVVTYCNYNILFRILGIDKNPEPGYSIFYFYSKFIFYISLLFLIYVPFLIAYCIKNYYTIKQYCIHLVNTIRGQTTF
jgi:GR25 family glycosyltransferase involved in LPS biosynthesis